MKRIVFFLFLSILIVIPAFSETTEEVTRILTAYKEQQAAGENPPLQLLFSLVNSSEKTINANEEVFIPQEFRQLEYNAFSWILSGNIYGSVKLSFSFATMVNVDGATSGTTTIPYKVRMVHEGTKIGNTTISSYKKQLTDAEKVNLKSGSYIEFPYIANNTSYTYNMYYADYYIIPNQISVTTASADFDVEYNFSKNTVVECDTEGAPAFSDSNPICNYWNRYGKAYVYLNIPSTPTGYAGGNYAANVILTITPTT